MLSGLNLTPPPPQKGGGEVLFHLLGKRDNLAGMRWRRKRNAQALLSRRGKSEEHI